MDFYSTFILLDELLILAMLRVNCKIYEAASGITTLVEEVT
jgi:hypothetical protein